ncbi:MAG: glutamine-hydrolyzing GMP synthase, partial [Bacillota bacterium]
MDYDTIVVLDYGSQTNRLIARRVRELGVFSELFPSSTTASEIRKMGRVKGIILSGGPNSVYDEDALTLDPAIFDLGIPMLGICYGMQLLVHRHGGTIEKTPFREYGSAKISVEKKSRLLHGLDQDERVWMSHGDHVKTLPESFRTVASSPSCAVAAIEDTLHSFYGVQFHPEVDHTEKGRVILRNFVHGIAGAKAEWTMENYIESEVETIRKATKGKRVILGLSGGVDSSVTAKLIDTAIGE